MSARGVSLTLGRRIHLLCRCLEPIKHSIFESKYNLSLTQELCEQGRPGGRAEGPGRSVHAMRWRHRPRSATCPGALPSTLPHASSSSSAWQVGQPTIHSRSAMLLPCNPRASSTSSCGEHALKLVGCSVDNHNQSVCQSVLLTCPCEPASASEGATCSRESLQ